METKSQHSEMGVASVPIIQFINDNEAELHLRVRNRAAIELLQGLKDATQLEVQVESYLALCGNLATNATSASAVLTAAQEMLERNMEAFAKQATASGEALEKGMKKMREDLVLLLGELVKQSVDNVLKNNAALQKTLGDQSKELREQLEKRIQEDLVKHLTELGSKIDAKNAAEAAETALMEDSLEAGFSFQDAVADILNGLTAATPDVVDRVAETPGKIPRCKVGDFVVKSSIPHHGLDVVVVVETTDEDMSAASKQRAVLEEVKTAIANREADACLYLFRDRESMPEGLPSVKFGPNYVLACAEGNSVAALLELTKMLAAVNKRIERAKEESTDAGIDVAALREQLDTVERVASQFDEMNRLMGLVKGHAETAAKLSDKTKAAVLGAIEKFREEIESE